MRVSLETEPDEGNGARDGEANSQWGNELKRYQSETYC